MVTGKNNTVTGILNLHCHRSCSRKMCNRLLEGCVWNRERGKKSFDGVGGIEMGIKVEESGKMRSEDEEAERDLIAGRFRGNVRR